MCTESESLDDEISSAHAVFPKHVNQWINPVLIRLRECHVYKNLLSFLPGHMKEDTALGALCVVYYPGCCCIDVSTDFQFLLMVGMWHQCA